MALHKCKVFVALLLAVATVQGQCTDWDGTVVESFENGGSTGGWSQDDQDDGDWTTRQGETGTSGTGPSGAYGGRWYAHVDSSGTMAGEKTAILNSPCYDLQTATSAEFMFAYHMYTGSDVAYFGNLSLAASTDSGTTWTTEWNETERQGVEWQVATVNLENYIGSVVQLRIVRVTGDDYTTDVAIDVLIMSVDGALPPDSPAPSTGAPPTAPPGCNSVVDSPLTESFGDNDMGSWYTDDTISDVPWLTLTGPTGTPETGPTSAYEGDYYVYVESSNPDYPLKSAILNSPCFDLAAATTANFSFAYHMWGNVVDFGLLELEVSIDEGLTWTGVWNETSQQGDVWLTAAVDMTPYTGNTLRLRFVRLTGMDHTTDAALDLLSLSIDNLAEGETYAPTLAPTPAPDTPEPGTPIPISDDAPHTAPTLVLASCLTILTFFF